MPQKYVFRARAVDQQFYGPADGSGRAEERLTMGGQVVATKQPVLHTFKNGDFETTSKEMADYIRSRIEDGHLAAYEISPHAQAESPDSILARISELQLHLHTENHEDAVAELREILRVERDGPHREAVTAPLERIFAVIGVSDKKPGRPAGK